MKEHRISRVGNHFTLTCGGNVLEEKEFKDSELLADNLVVLRWADPIMEKHKEECDVDAG